MPAQQRAKTPTAKPPLPLQQQPADDKRKAGVRAIVVARTPWCQHTQVAKKRDPSKQRPQQPPQIPPAHAPQRRSPLHQTNGRQTHRQKVRSPVIPAKPTPPRIAATTAQHPHHPAGCPAPISQTKLSVFPKVHPFFLKMHFHFQNQKSKFALRPRAETLTGRGWFTLATEACKHGSFQ